MPHSKLALGLVTVISLAACGSKRNTEGYVTAIIKGAGDSATRGVDGAPSAFQQQFQASIVNSLQGLASRESDPDFKTQGTITISAQTTTCPSGGGTAVTNGSIDYSRTISGTASAPVIVLTFNDMDLTTVYSNCMIEGDDDKTYTISGTTNLTNVTGSFSVATTVTDVSSSLTLPLTGTVNITGDNVTKSNCALDVTSTNSLTAGNGTLTGSASWSGTICGTTTSGSTTFSTAMPTMFLEL